MGFNTPSIRFRNRRDSLRFSIGDVVTVPVADLLPAWATKSARLGSPAVTVVKIDHRRGAITLDVR